MLPQSPNDDYTGFKILKVVGSSYVKFLEFAAIVYIFCYPDFKKNALSILYRFRNLFIRKRSEKWSSNSWFLLHDNAPAHRSVCVEDFLAKNKVTTLEQLPYSFDQAPADFYLFVRLVSALKGRRCCDANYITKNTTEELKRLPK